MVTRDSIVKAARGWLGTPYHHQASLKGVGADCLGLIRGIWRELYGPEPEAMPAYTRDWGDATGSETLLAAASRHLVELEDVSTAQAGDVLVFRMRDEGVAKHAGILVSAPSPRRSSLRSRSGCFGGVGKPVSKTAPLPWGRGHRAQARRVRGKARPLTDSAQAALDSGLRRNDALAPARLIHAQEGIGVVEIELGVWWRRRAVAAFSFPSVG
jgi:NlpC/P60 family putative phage cell wall peptidase